MPEPLTHRQLPNYALPVLIWLVLTLMAAVAGPFATFDAFSFSQRLMYWAAIIGASVGLSCVVSAISSREEPMRWVLCWIVYVLAITSIVHIINSLVFTVWSGWGQFFYLLGVVALVAAMVHSLIWVLERGQPTVEQSGDVDPIDKFLRRLPLDKRGPLVRIEAQDHYLNVVTDAGEALILMRLSDAIGALGPDVGLRVHRSHWVHKKAVARSAKQDRRDVLVMRDDSIVPVSRGHKQAVKAAGLL